MGDPLEDFSVMAYLDRFSYKNPKQRAREGGGSGMSKKVGRGNDSLETIHYLHSYYYYYVLI